jgi:hypothetical protein
MTNVDLARWQFAFTSINHIRFRRPPHDVFGIEPFAVANTLRFRVWPETLVSLNLAGKNPALAGNRRPSSWPSPCDRGRTCVPMTGSSVPRWTGTAGCSHGRTPWRRPGG